MNRFLKETTLRKLDLPITWQDPGDNGGLRFRVEVGGPSLRGGGVERVWLEAKAGKDIYSPMSLRNMASWLNELAEALEVAD